MYFFFFFFKTLIAWKPSPAQMVYTSLLRTSQVLGYRTRFLSFCELRVYQVNPGKLIMFFGGGGIFCKCSKS